MIIFTTSHMRTLLFFSVIMKLSKWLSFNSSNLSFSRESYRAALTRPHMNESYLWKNVSDKGAVSYPTDSWKTSPIPGSSKLIFRSLGSCRLDHSDIPARIPRQVIARSIFSESPTCPVCLRNVRNSRPSPVVFQFGGFLILKREITNILN